MSRSAETLNKNRKCTLKKPEIALDWTRVVIEEVSPTIDMGAYPIKRTVGESVPVKARIFCDGHDKITALLLYRKTSEQEWQSSLMHSQANDWWKGQFLIESTDNYEYCIQAWVDRFESWRSELEKKWNARVDDLESCLLEGTVLIRTIKPNIPKRQTAWFNAMLSQLGPDNSDSERVQAALDPQVRELMFLYGHRNSVASSVVYKICVERELARFGAWYEFFPRSTGPGLNHGTFATAAESLPRIAEMGFDIVYLPPVHPIGKAFRKGPNNKLIAGPDDPGSPWAIGGAEGGHKAVHPELGTMKDFDSFVKQARKHRLEVALDIALQCSPDHPYVKNHPEWFQKRPDGSIKYAENPPKKYQDIYPFDFECEAWQSLWTELKSIFEFWIAKGVTVFRVDNPHTKPLDFWKWLIGEIKRDHPETIFLAEAFTRPAIMRYLAKAGFSQSYSYFTWRNSKQELTEFLTDLTQTDLAECMRPNFFANTPDILHEFLQTGGRPAFEIRLILAATLGANYGIYGPPFELCVGQAVPNSEEYLNSEKYEIRDWNLNQPDNLTPLITRINRIRRDNPALQYDRYLEFLETDNPYLLAYVKRDPNSENMILAVVNLDPYRTQAGFIDFAAAGQASESFQVHDLLSDARYLWQGTKNFVSLDPSICPAHLFKLRRKVKREQDFEYFE